MSPLRSAVLTGVMLVVGALLVGGRLAPSSLAATPPDRSEIVLVLDFSASILDDAANRDRFAAALDRIADRINATSADLVVGDATVSLVQFAASAADYPGCVGMRLLDSPPTVVRFADCLRSVANAYRKGLDPALTRKIGIDTNYVAAMERAAGHLAVDAVRPALILFTDGRHDVAGVPVGQVVPARDRLFGNRSPFAFLPVGMGLSSTGRDALENGLLNLRIIREMPACVSGAQFDWPQVVFESPGEAGNAVALALQNVTCTFTVEPTPTPAATPLPTPTPEPTPGAVRGITLTPGDGRIEVAWNAPATPPEPIVDYRTRCRTGGGDWMESAEGVSIKTSVAVEGLTNGVPYECEVMTVDATGEGSWIAGAHRSHPHHAPVAPGETRGGGHERRGADPGADRERRHRVRVPIRMLGRPGRNVAGATPRSLDRDPGGRDREPDRRHRICLPGLRVEQRRDQRPVGGVGRGAAVRIAPVVQPGPDAGPRGRRVPGPRGDRRGAPGALPESNARVRRRRRGRCPHGEPRIRAEAGARIRAQRGTRTGDRDRLGSEPERRGPHSVPGS